MLKPLHRIDGFAVCLCMQADTTLAARAAADGRIRKPVVTIRCHNYPLHRSTL